TGLLGGERPPRTYPPGTVRAYEAPGATALQDCCGGRRRETITEQFHRQPRGSSRCLALALDPGSRAERASEARTEGDLQAGRNGAPPGAGTFTQRDTRYVEIVTSWTAAPSRARTNAQFGAVVVHPSPGDEEDDDSVPRP